MALTSAAIPGAILDIDHPQRSASNWASICARAGHDNDRILIDYRGYQVVRAAFEPPSIPSRAT